MSARSKRRASSESELDRAAAIRRRADVELPMRERLARLQRLCKQMSAVKGSAHHR